MKFFRKLSKKQEQEINSKSTAKERLHLVLMQDRANVSADFLDLMKQEIIEVIKKYIEVDESAIDVRLTNKENEDGTNGAPALYANIPIVNIKDEVRKNSKVQTSEKNKEENVKKENTENSEIVEENTLNEDIQENEIEQVGNDDAQEKNEDIKEEKDEDIDSDIEEKEDIILMENDQVKTI
jgi:cell division topological specificity factor